MSFQRSFMAGRADQIRQNLALSEEAGRAASRPAFANSLHTLRFNGHGDVLLPEIKFDLKFDGEPTFTSGVILLGQAAGDQWRRPQVTPFLNHWVSDESGIYIGAQVGLAVLIVPAPNVEPTIPPDAALVIHLSFAGIAYRGPTTAIDGMAGRSPTIS